MAEPNVVPLCRQSPDAVQDMITVTVPRVVLAAAGRAMFAAADPRMHASWMAHVSARYAGVPSRHDTPLLERRFTSDPLWDHIGGTIL